MARFVLMLAATLAVGCAPTVAEFACAEDSDCGPGGACEPTGACSFADETCDSGRRYGGLSAAELASACVTCEEGGPCGCIEQIEAGGQRVCARREDGSVWCTSLTSDEWSTEPPEQQDLANAELIDVGGGGGVCIATLDQVECRQSQDDVISYDVDESVASGLASGGTLACILAGTIVYCAAQDGDGTFARVEDKAAMVAAGDAHACAVTTEGELRCWGANDNGQLGIGNMDVQKSPTLVQGLARVTALGLGTDHSCAVSDGALSCWGKMGTIQHGSSPVAVDVMSALGTVHEVCAGENMTCAIVGDDRAVYCHGSNRKLQLGPAADPSQGSLDPVAIGLVDVETVSCGGEHVCVRTGDHRLRCWGAGVAEPFAPPFSCP